MINKWIELYHEEELEELDEKCKVLKEPSWEVKSFSRLGIIAEVEAFSSELESWVSNEVSTKLEGQKEGFGVSRCKD